MKLVEITGVKQLATETNQQYMPADLAKLLHISVPTLRKYSLLVEKVTNNSNYFTRNQQNVRSYTEKNLIDLQKLVALSKQRDMTLQSAAQQIFAKGNQQQIITSAAQLNNRDDQAQLWELCQRLKGEVLTTRQRLIKLEERIAQLEARPTLAGTQPVAPNPEANLAADPTGAAADAALIEQTVAKNAATTQTVSKEDPVDPEPETAAESTTDSGLKFTEPLPSDDPAAAESATHHLTFDDEKGTNDQEQVYDHPHSLADMQLPDDNKTKKQSWWHRVTGK
ncbi:hypothetical protein [Lapidilactobacillus gannanensis]|uniref:HTH merR-type domain-containing protein n=1 Tax=Lapidilactobacillus gannanensis TaxID=2486002 RepID=A0ABW4BQH1_9LACO|nr:hypothetical protein [Lapidilactobacillus gannanensis]